MNLILMMIILMPVDDNDDDGGGGGETNADTMCVWCIGEDELFCLL